MIEIKTKLLIALCPHRNASYPVMGALNTPLIGHWQVTGIHADVHTAYLRDAGYPTHRNLTRLGGGQHLLNMAQDYHLLTTHDQSDPLYEGFAQAWPYYKNDFTLALGQTLQSAIIEIAWAKSGGKPKKFRDLLTEFMEAQGLSTSVSSLKESINENAFYLPWCRDAITKAMSPKSAHNTMWTKNENAWTWEFVKLPNPTTDDAAHFLSKLQPGRKLGSVHLRFPFSQAHQDAVTAAFADYSTAND